MTVQSIGRLALLAGAAVLFAGAAQAETTIYKCQQKEVIEYRDYPCNGPNMTSYTVSSWGWQQPPITPPSSEVTLYASQLPKSYVLDEYRLPRYGYERREHYTHHEEHLYRWRIHDR